MLTSHKMFFKYKKWLIRIRNILKIALDDALRGILKNEKNMKGTGLLYCLNRQ